MTHLTPALVYYRTGVLTACMPRGWTAIRLTEDGLLCRTKVGAFAIWQGDRLINTALRA